MDNILELVKKHKMWIVIVIMILGGGALYYFSQNDTDDTPPPSGDNPPPSGDNPPPSGGNPPPRTSNNLPKQTPIKSEVIQDTQIYLDASGKKLGNVKVRKGTPIHIYRQANGYVQVDCCENWWIKSSDVK